MAERVSGYRQELLYQGVEGGTLRLTYREFKDDLARPAFFQQVSYSLNAGQPTEVTFKSVRLTVFEANNQGIRYVVGRGFR